MARVVFLWHLHQPEYRDPVTGRPVLPWVRLHSTRAYTDMAAALEPHDDARVVANWAPSLLLQLEAYASGRAVDRDEEIARKPVDTLTPAERAHVVKESFAVDWGVWVKPVPRYAELLAKRGTDLRRIDLLRAQEAFSAQDLLDLEVHFMLAWMGFAARREEPLVAELIGKERGYAEADKLQLLELSRRMAGRVVPRWKALAERGIVEIACSPMFHPILPLLIDSDSARRATPDMSLPPRFRHPEDAREQVRRGLSRAAQDFGARPGGMWPSEGSVSPEVIGLLGEEGVRWCATDQGILERSELATQPGRGAPHHAPWACGELAVFFRDRDLSDAVGFRYARSAPRDAVSDLLQRIEAAGADATVTVALDGENPWEHYPQSGEPFLRELYTRLRGSGVTAVLPRDEIAARKPAGRISRIHSGSWIDANYRIWIGHAEDNRAWSLLGQARSALDQARPRLMPEQLEKAWAAALAAEGSDWFWWYGDDFATDNAPEFDALFRRQVEQIYRHIGLPPPERLALPIISPSKDKTQAQPVMVQPQRLIHPLIDGYSRSYYEWAGAGFYRPGTTAGSSMYQNAGAFLQLWHGFSLSELFLRLDPVQGADTSGELRILLTTRGGPDKALAMTVQPGAACPVRDESGAQVGAGRCGALVELSISLTALGLSASDHLRVLLRLVRSGVEVDRFPRYGELEMVVPDRSFERTHWHV
ncbi:MAG TPA: glycoside hydrolase family 57 protein [Myxococcales bacterium]|nr:glycoside hydrolase family 57 protein [Myxococcales bacterium]